MSAPTAAAAPGWTPHDKLTTAPTNLKEAIDWVLRVTGRDGKKNVKPTPSKTSLQQEPGLHCLCYLAKAVKDLLYDAGIQYSTETTSRDYTKVLLPHEKSIVQLVFTDLGLDSNDKSNPYGCGATEVIRRLIDHLAQGLQKWVGWQEGDECCLKGEGNGAKESTGIGKRCICVGDNNCCSPGAPGTTTCHECTTCGPSAANKCYQSAYQKNTIPKNATEEHYLWTTISGDSSKVHLLARIFLGSVCLIWSGISLLGFLTGGSSGRWKDSKLHDIEPSGKNAGLGSFMAAMGYDLDRLNQGKGQQGKKGTDVWKLLSGQHPDDKKGIKWNEFKNGTSAGSVAEYYSSIYTSAKEALSAKKTEEICKQYPLLVLHILASGYFRAGSAGAKGVTTPPKAASKKEETPSPRKPRTIREILYWLSALPYSEKYRDLVERMGDKFPEDEQKKGQLQLHSEGNGASTTLLRDNITHYLMAACGYCPLVLIGIQGTIATSGTDTPATGQKKAEPVRCPKHKDNRNHRCKLDEKDKTADTAAQALTAPAAPASAAPDGKLQPGQVCYGGYHLEVSKFGPLHGMYANGLFGFDMDGSPAQCLDQLRIYVYHCFYQLYFLRKQCKEGVAGDKVVLGWKSCRYGSGVRGTGTKKWHCQVGKGNNCQCKESASSDSPLMAFLRDAPGALVCGVTVGKTPDSETNTYPEIKDHMEAKEDIGLKHFGKPPLHCPVPMGWQGGNNGDKDNHFKDLSKTHKTLDLTPPPSGSSSTTQKYPAHCTGNTLSYLLEYYCDPVHCSSGTLVVLLRLLACITPTVPRTLGDLFGFYYYIVYIGGNSSGGGQGEGVYTKLEKELKDVRLDMLSYGDDAVVTALTTWSTGGDCSGGTSGSLKCLYTCANGAPSGQCSQYLSPLSGQQYGQLSPAMAGTYLSWLVYLIEKFEEGLGELQKAFKEIDCKDGCNTGGSSSASTCDNECKKGFHGTKCNTGDKGVCGCTSVVSCTGVLPVLYKYGFGYGNVEALHKGGGDQNKKCHHFLGTLESVLGGEHLKTEGITGKGLHHEINQLIYTTRLPWIFVLTLAWLVAILYLAFGAIWPLDWTHMRSHCRGWFRKGSLSPWEVLMVGKKKGRGILEFFGGN